MSEANSQATTEALLKTELRHCVDGIGYKLRWIFMPYYRKLCPDSHPTWLQNGFEIGPAHQYNLENELVGGLAPRSIRKIEMVPP